MVKKLISLLNIPGKENFWKGQSLKEFFEVRNELRTSLAHPYIYRQIKNEKDILDYGCGKAELLNLFDDSFDGSIIGYDPNSEIIEDLKIKSDFRFNAEFFDNIECLNGKFDAIVLSFVLITIDNREECEKVLSDCFRLLNDNGRVLIIETHPNFRTERFSTYRTNMRDEWYTEEYKPVLVTLSDALNSKNEITFYDYHKSLKELGAIFSKNSFKISKIDELMDFLPVNSDSNTKRKFNQFSPP